MKSLFLSLAILVTVSEAFATSLDKDSISVKKITFKLKDSCNGAMLINLDESGVNMIFLRDPNKEDEIVLQGKQGSSFEINGKRMIINPTWNNKIIDVCEQD